MRIFTVFLLVTVLCISLSCDRAEILPQKYPLVFLSDIAEISESGVRLHAQLLGSDIEIEEAGFIISFNDKPSIGDRKIVAEDFEDNNSEVQVKIESDLWLDSVYYVRAFAKTENLIIYSNQKSFKSKGCKPPRIDHLYPESSSPGRLITIVGEHFSTDTLNNKVLFGSAKANVIKATGDTLLVQCPVTTFDEPLTVSLEVAMQESRLPSSFRTTNSWKVSNKFPGEKRFESSFFTIGSKGYVTLGSTGFAKYASKELWEYDIETAQWRTMVTFPGEKRSSGISFSIENFGYVGLGHTLDAYIDENNIQLKALSDLWRFDSYTNTWERLADFPGKLEWGTPNYFVAEGKLYFYYSRADGFWVYDPVIDKWSYLTQSLPNLTNKYYMSSLTIEDKGFLIKYFFDNDINRGIVEYNKGPKTIFFYDYFSESEEYDFKFVTAERAVMGIARSDKVVEFYPR